MPHPDITIAAFAELWLQARARYGKPRTIETYRDILGRHVLPFVGARPVADLDVATLRPLIFSLRLGPATQAQLRACVSSFCRAAVEQGYLAANPVRDIPPPKKVRPQRVVLDEAQFWQLIEMSRIIDPLATPIWTLCGAAGLRIGEALALTRNDVDLERRVIHVRRTAHRGARLGPTKNNLERRVDIPDAVVTEIAAVVDHAAPWLFPGKRGPLSYHRARAQLAPCCRAAGLPVVNLHSLRHTAASVLIARGASVAYVQRWLGHEHVSLTVDYYGSHLPMARAPELDYPVAAPHPAPSPPAHPVRRPPRSMPRLRLVPRRTSQGS